MTRIPQVEVLLATYNGEKYISDFLCSLLSQKGVEIHLRVSDDGSVDRTLQILEDFKQRFASYEFIKGPQKGPAANFFSLMQKSTHYFIALADQDDVWVETHLIDSINRLQLEPNPLTMTFSKVIETANPFNAVGKVWPRIIDLPEFHEIFFENFARGCTMVMKKNLVDLVCEHKTENAVMHDWWIFLVAKSCGVVIFSSKVEVKYRLHSSNTVGRTPKLRFRIKSIIKVLSSKNWAPWMQLELLHREFIHQMPSSSKNELNDVLELPQLDLKDKIIRVFFSNRKYRKQHFSDFLVKTYLVFKDA